MYKEILFLCKRRPQGKDLIERPYGRFYYLPRILAEKGHDVQILLLSYKNEPKIVVVKDGIHWTSLSLLKHGPFAYLREAEKIIKQIKPNWVVGFSDTYYGILAQRLGTKYNISSLIDAYDNYESYIPWFIPLHYCWRRAISEASLVTSAGPNLGELLNTNHPKQLVQIIPMAADPTDFMPRDRMECRQKLGLPSQKKLVGYCGSIFRNRGIEVLFKASKFLSNEIPNFEMILTGRKERGLTIPKFCRWLGYISDDMVPLVLNSMDVLVVTNRLSSFGTYSYPVKLYEGMKCHIPIVTSDTPPARWILKGEDKFLSKPEDPVNLFLKIKNLLPLDRFDYGENNSWDKSCDIFEKALLRESSSCQIFSV